jgi:hypothetical protein
MARQKKYPVRDMHSGPGTDMAEIRKPQKYFNYNFKYLYENKSVPLVLFGKKIFFDFWLAIPMKLW